MAIIKNVDKLRIREIEENLANDKVLTIDSTGLVAWKNQGEITPDLSAYYTKSEIDALLENISYNDLLDVPTNLSDFNNDEGFITISDVPSYTSGDGVDITNNEIRIKQSVLDEINANTNKTLSDVTSEGNTTNVKMIGSEVFSNTMKEDFAQIKDVNDSGWGLLPLQSEMKIALTAKDGTTVLSSIDVSWLASGDLAVSIDDTDPQNPELVFSQGGVEVARIPASTLLSGVVRGGNLSGYRLQFKDGGNAVLFDIDLEDLFNQHYTKIEADGRFALRTRTITGTGALTGGGDLTDDRTIDLTATTKADIAKGVTAHDWGDFRDFGLGTEAVIKSGLLEDNNESGFYAFATSQQGFSFPRAIMLHRGSQNYGIIFSNSRDEVGFLTGDELVHTAWHSGNFNPSEYATESWSDGRFALRDRSITGTGSLTGGGDLTDNRTIDLTTTAKSDIAKGVEAYNLSNKAILTEMVSGNTSTVKAPDLNNIPNGSYTIGLSQDSTNSPFSVPRSLIRFGGNANALLTDIVASPNSIAFRNVGNNTWRELWHTSNLSNPATETWVNNQGFISDLSNYYTKNEALNQFVGLAGVQDIADTKTFLASPVVPNPTLNAHAVNKGWVDDEINGIQGQLEAFLVGSNGGRLSLGMSIYHILGKKIDVISGGGTITAPQDLSQILSGDLSIEIDEIPGLPILANLSVNLNQFMVGTTFREDVSAVNETASYKTLQLRQGAVTSNPLTSSIFTTGVRNISIKFHISGIIIIT